MTREERREMILVRHNPEATFPPRDTCTPSSPSQESAGEVNRYVESLLEELRGWGLSFS